MACSFSRRHACAADRLALSGWQDNKTLPKRRARYISSSNTLYSSTCDNAYVQMLAMLHFPPTARDEAITETGLAPTSLSATASLVLYIAHEPTAGSIFSSAVSSGNLNRVLRNRFGGSETHVYATNVTRTVVSHVRDIGDDDIILASGFPW